MDSSPPLNFIRKDLKTDHLGEFGRRQHRILDSSFPLTTDLEENKRDIVEGHMTAS